MKKRHYKKKWRSTPTQLGALKPIYERKSFIVVNEDGKMLHKEPFKTMIEATRYFEKDPDSSRIVRILESTLVERWSPQHKEE